MKKFILPCLILLVGFTVVSIFSSSVFAFFHDKDKTYFAADCSSLVANASEDNESFWNGAGVESSKKLISNEKDDYCELIKNRDSYTPQFKETFKLSYFRSRNKILDTLTTLKDQENKEIKLDNESIYSYSGSTLNIDGSNQARAASAIDNCVIELTADVNLPSNEVFKWDKNGVANAMGMVSGHLRFEMSDITRNKNVTDFCQKKKDLLKEKLIDDSVSSDNEQPETQGKSNKDTNLIQALNDWIKDTFGELNIEALVKNPPTDNDLQPIPIPEKSPSMPLTGRITELDGNADMQLKDGTWVELKAGDSIPEGAKVFTGYGVQVQLRLSDSQLIILDSLEEFNLELFQADPEAYRKEIKLKDGALRFKVQEGTMKTDMKVSTPNTTASIVGTDFGVSYDKDTGVSIWEIYDGSIEVEDNNTGEKKTLASSYGSPIKRLAITKDGSMAEKIAIPKSQKGMKIPVWVYIAGITVVAVGGLLFLKRRKLPRKKFG